MEEITFQEGDSKSLESAINDKMKSPIQHFEKELSSIRTGRASIAIIDGIKVECYGRLMPLKEVATLAAPDSRLLTIQPWDKTIIGEIEKAIMSSDVGVTPATDGTIIRLQLPKMSSARRDELTKVLSRKTEECRVGIRNVRKDFHNEIRDANKKKIISEDFAKRLGDLLQKITDSFIKQVDQMYDKKESELKVV
jgi:ribosome recycling factor